VAGIAEQVIDQAGPIARIPVGAAYERARSEGAGLPFT